MRVSGNIGKNWKLVLKALGITVLAFLLSELLVAPFSASTSSVFSSPEKTDFVLSDFYAQVADRRPVRRYSDKIVIVDIDRSGRDEIAEMLEVIALCNPVAIGVDINFEEPHDDDSRLLAALQPGIPVVLPVGLMATDSVKGKFFVSEKPFFYDSLPGMNYGAANLPGKYVKSSIREFPVKFELTDGSEQLSFVSLISKEASPESYKVLRERGNEVETIDYASLEIPVMSFADVYERPEALEGKVVMLGSVNEGSDMHSTPVNQALAGLSIHAYALSTVLNGEYYSSVPKYADYIMAFIVCFIIVLLNIGMKAKVRGLVLRLIQVAVVIIVVRVGYEMYVDHKMISNFSLTLLMVAFGLFATDIWNGVVGIREFIAKWWQRLRQKVSS